MTSPALIIDIDSVGWTNATEAARSHTGQASASSPAFVPNWQNVTSDEMNVTAAAQTADFPDLNDIVSVRRYIRTLIMERGGAIISCDVAEVGKSTAVRCVSKYRAGEGQAMAYAAGLIVPLGKWVVELSIRGSEHGITGVREAIGTQELMEAAGPSERQQLKDKIFPIEWKFERYEPGTRGDLALVLSDGEAYDPRFPDHPLSRVRRSLRRAERTFCVTEGNPAVVESLPIAVESRGKLGNAMAKLRDRFSQPARDRGLPIVSPPGQLAIQIRQPPVKPLSAEELFRELGPQGAIDVVLMEAIRRQDPVIPFPSLVQRQKMCRERMDVDLKKVIEQSQEQARELSEIRTGTDRMFKDLAVETTYVWIPQLPSSDRWFTMLPGTEGFVLPLFTSAAFISDFIEAKRLDCEPIQVSLKDLFSSFSELRNQRITAVEFNHCPRCTDPRPVSSLNDFQNDLDLRKLYAAAVSSGSVLAGKNHRIALREGDPAKRLAILQYTIAHIDPGAPAIHLEIAKIAVASGDSALLEQSRQTLTKYAPDYLALLPPSSPDFG